MSATCEWADILAAVPAAVAQTLAAMLDGHTHTHTHAAYSTNDRTFHGCDTPMFGHGAFRRARLLLLQRTMLITRRWKHIGNFVAEM